MDAESFLLQVVDDDVGNRLFIFNHEDGRLHGNRDTFERAGE
jgi:hypothetical protein